MFGGHLPSILKDSISQNMHVTGLDDRQIIDTYVPLTN